MEDKLFTSVLDESQRCGDDEGLVDTILFSRGRIQDFDKFKAPTSKSPPTNPKPPTFNLLQQTQIDTHKQVSTTPTMTFKAPTRNERYSFDQQPEVDMRP